MIREAVWSDVKEIARLCLQLGYTAPTELIKSRVERILQDQNNAIFVNVANGDQLSGWVHIFGKCLIELEYAEIGGLVVESNARRQGIGQNLMARCEEWARQNGYQEIRLRSGGQRKDAHEFYKRLGYTNINWQQVFVKKVWEK